MTLPMTARDLQGVYNILPTPALKDADLLTVDDTVDHDETTRLVRSVIDGGVDGIMTNGTFGEAATLSQAELEGFVAQVVREVDGAVPVFAGATALSTRETIQRGRRLMELGATGLFLGRPMWSACDDKTIIGYYSDVAEALPEAPIVIYDNPQVFKGKISTAVYRELAQIPTVIGAKYVALTPDYEADVEACGDDLTIMPLDTDWLSARRRVGGAARATWTGSGNCGMAPLIALREAINSSDYERAQMVSDEMRRAMETLFPNGSFAEFSLYNIPLEKARFAAGGLVDPGPARPPYHHVPQEYLLGAREAGTRWARLHQKYTHATMLAATTQES
ncbi:MULTISPECIES: dihydrodipicolinate synthase family protein [Micrococcaceae]|uniref:dihydrodipicolinate synthase family protein n=1 Tax=Micrococcaceae TaxID=1268 RepID=UPI0004B800EF|nr:dihydrodipicolinate synthase family protein [Arthrobacter sp. MA-N2]